jgi:hypothetical protein
MIRKKKEERRKKITTQRREMIRKMNSICTLISKKK